MRKTRLVLWYCLTVLSILLSTLCSNGQDTVKKIGITSTEWNYFIGTAYDSQTYKVVIDSLRTIQTNLEKTISNDSIIKNDCFVLIMAKNETIEATKELSDAYKSKFEKEEKKKNFWQKAAGSVGIVGATILIVQSIKK